MQTINDKYRYKTQIEVVFEQAVRYVLGHEPTEEELESFRQGGGMYHWIKKFGEQYEGKGNNK